MRQPWGQPRGSERDPIDDSAFDLLLLDNARKVLACGRFHFNALDEAQVRFMAVDENMRGCGYGSAFSRDWKPRQHVAALKWSC